MVFLLGRPTSWHCIALDRFMQPYIWNLGQDWLGTNGINSEPPLNLWINMQVGHSSWDVNVCLTREALLASLNTIQFNNKTCKTRQILDWFLCACQCIGRKKVHLSYRCVPREECIECPHCRGGMGFATHTTICCQCSYLLEYWKQSRRNEGIVHGQPLNFNSFVWLPMWKI